MSRTDWNTAEVEAGGKSVEAVARVWVKEDHGLDLVEEAFQRIRSGSCLIKS